jgi:nitronate monooxygenase
MWPTTKFTEITKTILPIIQAPMAGGATTPELIAAVSNAGGLGSLGAGYMQPDDIRAAIKRVRQLTDKPFSVNLFVPEKYHATPDELQTMQSLLTLIADKLETTIAIPEPPYLPNFDEQINIVMEEKIPVVSFTFGIPDQQYLSALKHNKTLIIGTVTSVHEALLWQMHGADIIAAQGTEAGGHRGTFAHAMREGLIGLMALIPQLVDKVALPVIAAGGIMDARGIIAALALGASGVQMGTAFLTCHESGIPDGYKQFLLRTKSDNTVLTKAFSGKFARGVNNQFIELMQEHEAAILDYPIQNAFTQPLRKVAAQQNNAEFLSLYAGQAAYLCKEISATELMAELEREVKIILKMM